MKKRFIILIHLIIWLLLSVGYFFLAEPIMLYIYAGVGDVSQWLDVLGLGLALIFIGIVISLIINLRRRRS